jgi:prevent-host-death family protein
MRIIGIRELKDRLSEVIRLVRRNEKVLISNRGEVVAELRSSYETVSGRAVEPGLSDLVAEGRLRLAAASGPPAEVPVLPSLLPEGAASRLLDEERGER